MVFFWAKRLMERWYLLITEKFLFWSFRRWKIRSFFQPKRWWKGYIYRLLKRSCFELPGDAKYGLFWVKKLMERWCLFDLLKLCMIFQGLANMVFCAVTFISIVFQISQVLNHQIHFMIRYNKVDIEFWQSA